MHALAIHGIDGQKGAVSASGADGVESREAAIGASAGHNHKRTRQSQSFSQRPAQHARATHHYRGAFGKAKHARQKCIAHGDTFAAIFAPPTGVRNSNHSVWNVPALSVRW